MCVPPRSGVFGHADARKRVRGMVGWSTAATRHEGEEHVTLLAVRACGREPAIHEEAEQHAVAPVSAIRSLMH